MVLGCFFSILRNQSTIRIRDLLTQSHLEMACNAIGFTARYNNAVALSVKAGILLRIFAHVILTVTTAQPLAPWYTETFSFFFFLFLYTMDMCLMLFWGSYSFFYAVVYSTRINCSLPLPLIARARVRAREHFSFKNLIHIHQTHDIIVFFISFSPYCVCVFLCVFQSKLYA